MHSKKKTRTLTRTHIIGLALAYTLGVPLNPVLVQAMEVRDLGSRLHPLVDNGLIEKMAGATLKLHSPIPRDIAVSFNEPWEGDTSAYVTVLKDDRYRMYYRCSGRESAVCYAESADGIEWKKPVIGLYSFEGSQKNNIVWRGEKRTLKPLRFIGRHSVYSTIKNMEKENVEEMNFAPFRDTNPKSTEPYKALSGIPPKALESSDGIHWRLLQSEPVMTGETYDSLNTAFWDPNIRKYVAYVRDMKNGLRSIVRRTSTDFVHWSKGVEVRVSGPQEHLYTNGIISYADGYIGLPMRFIEDRKVVPNHKLPGVSDAIFMSSRDGIHFDRHPETFIKPGSDIENWTDRSNMPAWGVVPTSTVPLLA